MEFYQTGGSSALPLVVYRGSPVRQKGRGIGNFFGSIFRRLIPLAKQYILPHAKNAVKSYVLPQAKQTIKNIAVDILDGQRPIKETLKARSVEGLKAVGKDIISQSGSGRHRKRKSSRSVYLPRKRIKSQKGRGKKKQKKSSKSVKRKSKKHKTVFD